MTNMLSRCGRSAGARHLAVSALAPAFALALAAVPALLFVSAVAVAPALLFVSALAATPAVADSILGTAPAYADKTVGPAPNERAFLRRIWAPGLDAGYVPQGLTQARGQLLMVAYLSTESNPDRGPSRVFQVDPASGRTTGWFDLPAEFGHPGGLAFGDNTLYVADHAKLLRVDLNASLKRGLAAVTGRRAVDPAMGPSFLAYRDRSLWFGRWLRPNQGQPYLYAVPAARIFPPEQAHGERALPLLPADAAKRVMMPLLVQGAAFDSRGQLWLSASTQRFGRLYRMDVTDGRVVAEYAVPAGIEDLAHAPAGKLWAVGEAGSKRWLGSATFWPLIWEIDPALLKPERH